jgi:hypothetical protein
MDNGTYFAVRELKEYCDDVGIRQDLAFVAHPHYNGKVERATVLSSADSNLDLKTIVSRCMSFGGCVSNQNVVIKYVKAVLLGKDDEIREDLYPCLYYFAKRQDITMKEAWTVTNENMCSMLHLPLSIVAHEKMHSLLKKLLLIRKCTAYKII